MVRARVAMHIATGHGWCICMGGVSWVNIYTYARAHVQIFPSVPYLGNGWTDSAEIWKMVRDQLAMHFTLLWGRVHLHVSTCTPIFRISRTVGRTALKFGMLLETSYCNCTSFYAYLSPLVHCSKGVLLVLLYVLTIAKGDYFYG